MSTSAIALPGPAAMATSRQRVHWHDRLAQVLLLGCCALLALFLLGPMVAILIRF